MSILNVSKYHIHVKKLLYFVTRCMGKGKLFKQASLKDLPLPEPLGNFFWSFVVFFSIFEKCQNCAICCKIHKYIHYIHKGWCSIKKVNLAIKHVNLQQNFLMPCAWAALVQLRRLLLFTRGHERPSGAYDRVKIVTLIWHLGLACVAADPRGPRWGVYLPTIS